MGSLYWTSQTHVLLFVLVIILRKYARPIFDALDISEFAAYDALHRIITLFPHFLFLFLSLLLDSHLEGAGEFVRGSFMHC